MHNRTASWWLASGWLLSLLTLAVVVPWLPLPYPAGQTDVAAIAAAPAAAPGHWLGTDALGRDLLAEVLYGARTLLSVSVPATLLLALVALLLGGAAGYWGNPRLRISRAAWLVLGYSGLLLLLYLPLIVQDGAAGLPWAVWQLAGGTGLALVGQTRWGQRPGAVPLDKLVLGLASLLGSVPKLLLLVVLVAVLPLGPGSAVAVLGLLFWPGMMRLVRAEVLRIRALPHLEAARALGLPVSRLLVYHVWPLLRGLFGQTLLLYLALIIGLETTLGFLGIGLPAEYASWGKLLATARLMPEAWWVAVFPGLSLVTTLLSLRVLAPNQKLPGAK